MPEKKRHAGQQRELETAVDDLLGQTGGKIIAGPWLGEVGWEVLYWIPLLRWCINRRPELRGRLVAVSRGGVSGWYDGVAETYVDLGEAYTEDEFARRLEEDRAARKARGETRLKPREGGPSAWELEIADWVSAVVGEPPMPMLHPSLLYRGAGKVIQHLVASEDPAFTRWPRPDRGELASVLPERYVAVRFYRNRLLKGVVAERLARAASRLIEQHVPVVLVAPQMEIDLDHPEFDLGGVETVRLGPGLTFENNLAVQSIAIANAAAFVGTFGGLAFIPPHYGVPTFCFWTATTLGSPDTKTGAWRDLDLARQVYNRPGWGGFSARSFHDAPLEELLAPVLAK